MKKLLLFTAIMTLTGCGGVGGVLKSLQQDVNNPSMCRSLSSGVIGCRASDIVIYDETSTPSGTGRNVHEWVAECRGKQFVCSHVNRVTNCAEAKD